MLHFGFLLIIFLLLMACAGKTPVVSPTSKPPTAVVLEGKVEKVSEGYQFLEGPAWNAEGYLLFTDIPANTIYRWNPDEGTAEVYRSPSSNANGLAFDPQGRLLACEHSGRRVSRTEADGSVVSLAESYDGKLFNSPNDLALHADGSIYFTDPPYGLPNQKDGKELDFNGVYRLAVDGTLTLLDQSFERPNGLAFSLDQKTLYVDDSHAGHIKTFDVQPDGTLANGRVLVELKEPGKSGVPDGMVIDAEGNIFCTGPGGIWVVSPSGEVLQKIVIPEQPANVTWGDADLKTLYITARTGLYRVRVNTGGKVGQ